MIVRLRTDEDFRVSHSQWYRKPRWASWTVENLDKKCQNVVTHSTAIPYRRIAAEDSLNGCGQVAATANAADQNWISI